MSWAVPRGPTLDDRQRRLCIHVEDHGLDYFDFEGKIPAGSYGAGDVIVWDWGRWRLRKATSADAAVRSGDLHIELDGVKLRGRFALVRLSPHERADARENWLLIHGRDEHAVTGWDAEAHPRSVKSGRTNDDIAAQR